MKKFLVVLLACALIFGFAATASAAIPDQVQEFSDIADQGQAARNAIMKLAVLGVVEGNEGIGGAFRPADNLTRAEFAKIVCYLTGNVKQAEALASVGSKFSDVSTGNWYTGWVNMAAQSGYFVGDPGGTFRPNANITMQEVVTVALRAAGYTDKLGSSTGNTTWPGNYINKAMNVGLLDDVTFVGSAAATRSDMAVICEAVLGINMVVHIGNEIAYALALSGGDVDPDGFSEVYYLTNETDKRNEIETILHKAFDGTYYDLQINPAYVTANSTADSVSYGLLYDESDGWHYADFATGVIALNINQADLYKNNKKFEEYKSTWVENNETWHRTYTKGDELAKEYYITRDFDLTELSGMQVQLTVIDDKEICFVDVVSSYALANKIHQDRADGVAATAQNIMVDGKSYRASNTMYINGRVGYLDDYAIDFYSGWDEDENKETQIMNIFTTNNDNSFPGKVYLDKDGRIYGVKNYNAYDETSFGIVDKEDNNRLEWKFDWNLFTDAMKFETNKNYTLYKDGDFITAEELDENDAVFRLGSTSVPFYYVTSPEEGDLTAQNKVNNRLTIDGTVWRLIHPGSNFAYSDDGGETFTGINVSNDDVEFGTAEYAKAYNFYKLAYVASNLTNNKIIGVITKIEPAQVWSASGGTREDRYEEITIYNAEGKEVTYKFTTDFRDAYNWAASNLLSTYTFKTGSNTNLTDWNKVKNAGENMGSRANNAKGEIMSQLLAKGDIVQLVVDKNDKVKRLDNYASFAIGSVEATVSSSNSRMTIKNGNVNSTNGTYTVNTDAVIFNVTPENDGSYDDVGIQSVASLLAKDFDAAKIVAFDVKTGARIAVLYVIDDTTVYQYGIISGQGRDSTGYYYMINDKKVYASDPIDNQYIPGVISYTVSGGEATISPLRLNGVNLLTSGYLAVGVEGGAGIKNTYFADIRDAVSAMGDANSRAVVGEVQSYASATKALQIGSTYVYITSDTYLYDLLKDDDVSSPADLKNKMVMAFYDKDNNAYFVARVGTATNTGGTTGSTGGTALTDQEALEAARTAIGTNVTVAFVDFANLNTPADVVKTAIEGIINNANITVEVTQVVATNDYTVTLKLGSTTLESFTVTAQPATVSSDASVTSVDGKAVTWGFNLESTKGTVADPFTGAISVAANKATITVSDILTGNAGATVGFHQSVAFTSNPTAKSIPLAAGPNTVWFTVTAENGTVILCYELTVSRVDLANDNVDLDTLFEQTVGLGPLDLQNGGTGTFWDPYTGGEVTIANSYASAFTAANVEMAANSLGATVTLYTNSSFDTVTSSITLAVGAANPTKIYFTVESVSGATLEYYIVDVIRNSAGSGNAITNATTVAGRAIAADTGTNNWKVTLPYGTDISALTKTDIVLGGLSSGATASDPTTADNGATWIVVVTAESGAVATHTIKVSAQVITTVNVALGGITAATYSAAGGADITNATLVILDQDGTAIAYFGTSMTVGDLTNIAKAGGGSYNEVWSIAVDGTTGAVTLRLNNVTIGSHANQNVKINGTLDGHDVVVTISWTTPV